MEKDQKDPKFVNNFSVNPSEDVLVEKTPSRSLFLRFLILGVVLVVLVVLSIGIVKLVPAALSSFASVDFSFSSLFSPKEKITVTANKTKINSGETFTVNFKHTGANVDGYFNLSTTCQKNYRLEYMASANARRPVDCENTLHLDASSTSFVLIGINNNGSAVTLPVSVDFVSKIDGKVEVTGETSIVINPSVSIQPNNNGDTNPPATSTPPHNNGNPGYSNPPTTGGGTADLIVRITAIGVRDRNTGVFTPTGDVNTNDRVTVQFQVDNIGTAATGPWALRAILPAVNPGDQTKYLYNQSSIPPGIALAGEMFFDYVQTGQNRLVQINVDVNNQVQELREDNNMASITINATNSGVTSNGVDLAVDILDTGIIQSNGQYVRTSNINSGDRAGVRVQVTNRGSDSSGTWVMRVSMPDSNDNFEQDITQSSLAGGETRIFTVGLDGLNRNSDNTVEINVDPSDRIDETNENNNDDSVNISVN